MSDYNSPEEQYADMVDSWDTEQLKSEVVYITDQINRLEDVIRADRKRLTILFDTIEQRNKEIEKAQFEKPSIENEHYCEECQYSWNEIPKISAHGRLVSCPNCYRDYYLDK